MLNLKKNNQSYSKFFHVTISQHDYLTIIMSEFIEIFNYFIIFSGGILFGVTIFHEILKKKLFKLIIEYEHKKMLEKMESATNEQFQRNIR